jgi:hypothetical protein
LRLINEKSRRIPKAAYGEAIRHLRKIHMGSQYQVRPFIFNLMTGLTLGDLVPKPFKRGPHATRQFPFGIGAI